ncbi:hypothetical protein ECTPHS_10184 [Ectothiorhodospira sp. PHS-1]|uniref:hypothetical protein n=1 Tax=Ectothiorhodospira sp. PHS-1 TaxID=519989 RepID=UPI00024A89DC|nr:hypothetical protein [Ectothiorhodospira sp. PHS-1]EHQ53048.1 hypothetical protein ECTPHS_10184 [Ectothiorhodospira sp. PHS-1]
MLKGSTCRAGVRGTLSFSSRHLAVALLCCLLVVSGPWHGHAAAADAPARDLTLYAGQGVDSDLLQMPKKLVDGSLDYESSYFTALGFRQQTPTPGFIDTAFGWIGVSGVTTGAEAIVVRHYGLQDNWELDVAYVLASPQGEVGPVRLRAAMSLGLSYAFGNPAYEDGPKDDPERRYRFQNYNGYEVEWGLVRYPQLSFITRVHHRSGIYGVIAPRRVGSNFVTFGLRYHW